MNLEKIYEYALQREEEGYRFFKNNAEKATHAAVAEIFEKLAEEEQKHIQYIKKRMNTSGEEDQTGEMELTEDGWFEKRAEKEFLDQTLIESMIPDVAVLRTAYLIEHDLSEFYESAAENTTGGTARTFSRLAQWERTHERFFKDLHDRIFQEYTRMPWGG